MPKLNKNGTYRLLALTLLCAALAVLPWIFGGGWNWSIALYFGLRKMTYYEAMGALQAISAAAAICVLTAKLFAED